MVIKGVRHSPHGGHIVVLILFSVVSILSGLLTVPPIDRDESRFVQATTQMIETGNYIDIRFQAEDRHQKPIGIYWLQAGSVLAFADVEDRPLWAYRLPSLVGAMAAVVFTYLCGCALFGATPALLGAFLLAGAPVLLGEGAIAKADAALLGAIAGMMAALAWIVTAPDDRHLGKPVLGFWGALGVGILLKGLVAPLVAVSVLMGLFWHGRHEPERTARLWRRLRPLWGVVVLSALILPWFIAIGVRTEGRFFTAFLGVDSLGKAFRAQEDHAAPPGFHFTVFWVMFWPAALFALVAARKAIATWREGPVFFCLAWLVPLWILFELGQTKLPHYMMIAYPAIALLIGHAVVTLPETAHRGLRLAGIPIFLAIGFAATLFILFLAGRFSTAGLTHWHYLGGALVGSVAIAAAVLVALKKSQSALIAAAFASSLYGWGAFEGVLPSLDRLTLTPELAKMLDRNEAHPLKDNTGPLALVGYSEPSAVFTFGTDTLLLSPTAAAAYVLEDPRRAAVVESREEAAFISAIPPTRTARRVAETIGYNYSNNRDVELILYRIE
ncbi:hypothetical protein PB2503_07744 [Parvularcula bermudensis HTCC2503]|uniref:Glycosyltransferase RgtA/B/C/D-like domain-containing protein n=1 Tax=Parvularcula bermudensis (strain ATCC BAA-594 / HTCC2503 / KCTC 12087) TaxID=314260 RepID=E0TGI5_PARBH|nr:glycosyltransferase family 39 protein [Parvularcula bermudensis]ADM09604.1 hypothetical protein PB2503_07744 [Parvularcula bermudensis HTCC2503]